MVTVVNSSDDHIFKKLKEEVKEPQKLGK